MSLYRFNRAAEPSFFNSDFQYSTVSSFRADTGISVSDLSDSAALKILRNVSKSINLFTKNWFEPIRIVRGFNGKGKRELDFNGFPEAIEINSVSIANSRNRNYAQCNTVDSDLSENDISLSDCGSFLVNNRGYFPAGTSNIFVQGWFGKIEDHKHLEVYVSSGVMASGISSIKLNAVSGANVFTYGSSSLTYIDEELSYSNTINPRNIAIFLNSNKREIGRLIINSINYSNGVISFDPLQSNPVQTISSGIKVLILGSVPSLIEEASNLIAKDLYDRTEIELLGMKSEKTTDYQYTRATAFETGQPTLAEISSNSRANLILANFDNNSYVGL